MRFAFVIAAFAIAAAVATMVAGWIMNLFTLFGLETFAGEAALRTLGVFIPVIGGVLGWF